MVQERVVACSLREEENWVATVHLCCFAKLIHSILVLFIIHALAAFLQILLCFGLPVSPLLLILAEGFERLRDCHFEVAVLHTHLALNLSDLSNVVLPFGCG